jgi:hypothetical protein
MDKKKISLGSAFQKSGVASIKKSLSTEDRLKILERQLHALTILFNTVIKNKKEEHNAYTEAVIDSMPKNNDGVPLYTVAYGHTQMAEAPFILTVNEDGYYVGNTLYHSLSAAAEAVSGVRRSGWTFWRLHDGRSLKEMFKRRQ